MKGGSSRGHLLLWEPGHDEITDVLSNNLFKKESCLLNGKYETVLAWDGIDCWNWLWISCKCGYRTDIKKHGTAISSVHLLQPLVDQVSSSGAWQTTPSEDCSQAHYLASQ